jgi:hypothetical protein
LLIVLVCVVEIKCPCFILNWKKTFRIEVKNVEAGWLLCVSCCASNYEVDANRLVIICVSLYLPLLFVNMSCNTEPHDVLVSIHQCAPPQSYLSATLVNVRHMRKDNSLAPYFFKVMELLLKPLEHVSWICKLRRYLPVCHIAEVRVKRDQLREVLADICSVVELKRCRIEAPVMEVPGLRLRVVQVAEAFNELFAILIKCFILTSPPCVKHV